MKKIFCILAVMLALSQNMFSQDAEKKVTIQASPLLWFTDVFSTDINDTLFAMDLEGQFKITDNINVSLTLSFLIDNHTVTEDDYSRDISYKENMYQVNFKPMFVFRPFYTGLRGFYLGFYPNVGLLHVENHEKNQLYTEFGFGMNWGYKWVFRNGFTMQLGSGIGRTFSHPEGSRQYVIINSDGRISLSHTDIYLLDFKLGYSF
jgi:hypothetical protein